MPTRSYPFSGAHLVIISTDGGTSSIQPSNRPRVPVRLEREREVGDLRGWGRQGRANWHAKGVCGEKHGEGNPRRSRELVLPLGAEEGALEHEFAAGAVGEADLPPVFIGVAGGHAEAIAPAPAEAGL